MPELPEVEIVRQSLHKNIYQKKVKKVIVKNKNLRFKIPVNFSNYLKHQKIIKIDRLSKYLILSLSNQIKCIVHLGMSGTMHIVPYNRKKKLTNTSFYNSPRLPIKHNHIEIFFDNFKLVYNDPRRFGFFQIIKNKRKLVERFKNLGPEPFDIKFDLNYITLYLKKKEKNIKDFLLDQNFVAGIGNIYANEILFFCGIRPDKKASKLKKKECEKILIYSRKVLLNAIKKGGSSIRDFKNIVGQKGAFQKNFKVYQREGLLCKRSKCKGTIIKKIISNRSSFFCKSCQN